MVGSNVKEMFLELYLVEGLKASPRVEFGGSQKNTGNNLLRKIRAGRSYA